MMNIQPRIPVTNPSTIIVFDDVSKPSEVEEGGVVAKETQEQRQEREARLFRQAENAVILIAANEAKGWRDTVRYMQSCAPKAVIITEDDKAYADIMSGHFPPTDVFRQAAQQNALQKADVIAVFGQPKFPLQTTERQKIIKDLNFAMVSPPAEQKLRGLETTPYVAEFLSEEDKKDPAKVKRAAEFTRQRHEAAASLRPFVK